MPLAPGDRVEHFVILSMLGHGGMGEVYAARDTRLERTVALKILQAEPSGSESSQPGGASRGAARLLREARAAAALEHPNVVTIYEIGSVRTEGDQTGCPFIAMELVKGKPLRAFVGDEAVSIAERIRWLTDVAQALAAAHRANLVHRDVKPENVMVRDDGVIKVLDFGIAKRVEPVDMGSTTSSEILILPSLTAKGVAIGTPHYMAPEQMRREDLDGRADQFAWGVVAYELLSGTLPWGRQIDPLELVAKLLTETPRSLDEVRSDVPPHVVRTIVRAMSKRRADRFATMDDLAASLGHSDSAARSIAFDPTIPSVPGVRLARDQGGRSRRVSAMLAALAVGVALVGGVAWTHRSGSTSAPAVAAAPPGECTRSSECVAKLGGVPAVCSPSHRCAAVETAQCHALYEKDDLARDDVLWVGAMFPLTGDDARYGLSNRNAVELGRRDFAAASRSLRTPDGGDRIAPIAVLACDDATGGDAIASHLIDDVGVAAVIGFGGARSIELATNRFVPSGTLVLASISQSPLLTRVPQPADGPRLLWRSTCDNADVGRAIAASSARLESRLRAKGVLRADEPMRVAVARRKDASHTAFAESLFRALVINGKPALEEVDSYREFSLDPAATDEEFANAASQIATFRPTLVISSEDSKLVPLIEAAWPKGERRRPYYQTSGAIDDELLRFMGTNADRRARIAGFSVVSTTMPNARFVLHYNESFDDPITRASAPNTSYDAFYVIAYASYALAGAPATGVNLARGLAHLLPPGPSIEVGSAGILGAWGALSRGKNIDLEGATGSLDFDPETGDAPVNLAAVCASVDADGKAIDSIESGVVFLAKEGRLINESHCP